MKSFQALPYVALLIVMLFFIYAVIGMQVTTTIRLRILRLNLIVFFYRFLEKLRWTTILPFIVTITFKHFHKLCLSFSDRPREKPGKMSCSVVHRKVGYICAQQIKNEICVMVMLFVDYTEAPACDPKSDEARNNATEHCGTEFAIPYFISFYVLCSFLVS